VPPGVSVVVSGIFVMPIRGADAVLTLAVHGGAVAAGAHTPPAGGEALALLVTDAGGLALTVAVTA
jgi:hypothetical protein